MTNQDTQPTDPNAENLVQAPTTQNEGGQSTMLSAKRIFALACIFLVATAGWFMLGAASAERNHRQSYTLGHSVTQLWGGPMAQSAPQFSTAVPGSNARRTVLPISSTVAADLQLEHRRKGLIWYPTYSVKFSGEYCLQNSYPTAQTVRLFFPLPNGDATYDDVTAILGKKSLAIQQGTQTGVYELAQLKAGETQRLNVAYKSRGMQRWQYQPTGSERRVKNLDVIVTTNFANIDFIANSLSPMSKETNESGSENSGGKKLHWQASDLLTSQPIGVIMPDRINPGPLTTRVSFFAPVGLLFFFVLVTALGLLHKVAIHPMHYLFVAGGFFAFHLLFAYLVDVVNVHLAFLIAAAVAVGLVNSYLRAALGQQWPWKIAAAGLLFYLVLFSYSFFLNGITGLAITIGSVVTLAVLMRLTAQLDWSTVFGRSAKHS